MPEIYSNISFVRTQILWKQSVCRIRAIKCSLGFITTIMWIFRKKYSYYMITMVWFKARISDKRVEALRNEICFSSVLETFPCAPPAPPNNVEFFISKACQTTVPAQHWIRGERTKRKGQFCFVLTLSPRLCPCLKLLTLVTLEADEIE